MFVYVLLLLCCSFNGYIIDKFTNRNCKSTKHLLYITFFLLFIVSAIRFEVGLDYSETYVLTYKKIVSGVKNVRMDIGLKVIYVVMAQIQANEQWIFVITSFLINWFACKSIIKQSSNCKLSFWIYICGTFYFFSMNGVRQAIAMMLFYYSFQYIKEQNLKKYLVFNGIGILFHSSSVIFLPLYFVLNRKYKFKTKLFLIIGVVLASNFLVPFVISILLKTRYAMYLTNGYYTAQQSMNFSMYLNIFLFFLYEWVMRKHTLSEYATIYSNIHFCGVIVSLFTTSLPLVARIFMSFRFVEFLSVPQLTSIQKKRKYQQIIEWSIMLIYFAYFIWGVLIQNGNTVLPYKTIFSKNW